MRTNIDIDEKLMAEAMEALGARTKRDAVDKALREAIRIQRQLRAWDEMRGSGWDGDLGDMRTSKYAPAR
jgi:Arc/MetJ family transcription regulator